MAAPPPSSLDPRTSIMLSRATVPNNGTATPPQGKIASIYFSLFGYDIIRNYYIESDGRIMEIAWDDPTGWQGPNEIFPGAIADVGFGLAADTFQANGFFYVSSSTTSNLARG